MKIRLGTRGSQLALIQAAQVSDALFSVGLESEKITHTTHGDRDRKSPIYGMSSVGVFVEELNSMVLSGECDAAVHSAKDMPSHIDDGLEVSAVLPRASSNDVLVSEASLDELKRGAVIGTSSRRRISELMGKRSDIVARDIRGNIDTRLEKLSRGDYDGIILAKAALERMSLDVKYFDLSLEDFLPAPNQGIIAVVSPRGSEISKLLAKISHSETYSCFAIERELVTGLRLGCSMPVGILCTPGESLYRIFARFYSLKSNDYRSYESNVKHLEEARRMVEEIARTLPEGFGYGFGQRGR